MMPICKIIAGLFCLMLTCAGCTRIEEALVSPNIGDKGITGLASHPNKNSIKVGLEESPLQPGTVFAYDNPVEQWEVIGSDEYNLFWRGPRGKSKLTTFSTILPDLRWHGDSQWGRRMVTDVRGFLHPLEVGNSISFHEEILHSGPPGAFSGDWHCEVLERTEVTVPAGTFDTWQVLCKVNGLEYLLANYSEKISNNVRIIYVTDDNQVKVRQLITSSLLKDEEKSAGNKSKQ